MVSVELIGGLGNQMFQIAACIAYATNHRLEYHIPLKTQNSHSPEPYFTTLQNPAWDESKEPVYYDEPHFHYQEIPVIPFDPKKQNIILRGYFQSYKYFEGYNLGRLFFNDLTKKKIGLPIKKIKTVAVHVRKGDYELYPTKHPIISVDYISDALNYFKVKDTDIDVSFFSDNPEWCGQFAHLRKLSCNVIFEYDPVKSIIDLMRHHHFILSNSTFGYWAVIMNKWLYKDMFSEPVIIYPAKWFGSDYAHMDTKDMCPADWIKM